MTSATPHLEGLPPPAGPGHEDPLDPANQSLADALHRSFGILKLLMLVLVVLYFLSGWFSVKPNERGLILRYGRIVGATSGQNASAAVLEPGWHWSWPYPFESCITVPTSEREIPVEFMYQLSEQEQTAGISGPKFNTLDPMRDDYLMTGDVNILHATLIIKYRIADVVSYLTNVYNMPAPMVTERSPLHTRQPEYTVLTHLARDAVIETAARQEALVIRGSKQDEFLLAVSARLSGKLKELDKAGTPLGISVDPNNGVLAPKSHTVEAILPPRQTQEVFDKVFSAQTEKAIAIRKAESQSQELLLQSAGSNYQPLADAISKEYDFLTKAISAETSKDRTAGELRNQFESQRKQVDSLLLSASGTVQGVIKGAMIQKDIVVKEASGDWEQFNSLLPEYRRNPEIFLSRLRDETYARALDNKKISKMFVSKGPDGKIWLRIPRSGDTPDAESEKKAQKGVGASTPRKRRAEIIKP